MNQLFCMYMYYTSLVTRMGLTFVCDQITSLGQCKGTCNGPINFVRSVICADEPIFIFILIIFSFFWGDGALSNYKPWNTSSCESQDKDEDNGWSV